MTDRIKRTQKYEHINQLLRTVMTMRIKNETWTAVTRKHEKMKKKHEKRSNLKEYKKKSVNMKPESWKIRRKRKRLVKTEIKLKETENMQNINNGNMKRTWFFRAPPIDVLGIVEIDHRVLTRSQEHVSRGRETSAEHLLPRYAKGATDAVRNVRPSQGSCHGPPDKTR